MFKVLCYRIFIYLIRTNYHEIIEKCTTAQHPVPIHIYQHTRSDAHTRPRCDSMTNANVNVKKKCYF